MTQADLQLQRMNKLRKIRKLDQVMLASSATDETSNDALAKLMKNRHKQNEILDQLEKIYSCHVCLKQFKVYDEFNDDPEKCNDNENIELVDETTFMNKYKCQD